MIAILILMISQIMANPEYINRNVFDFDNKIKNDQEFFPLQSTPRKFPDYDTLKKELLDKFESLGNTQIEKIESVVYELLVILKHSKRSKIHMDLLNKIEQIKEERIKFESNPDQKLTAKIIRNLFKINFDFIDAIHTSLIKDVEEMDYSEELINRLIKEIE
jgi:hypothetical protein